MAAYASSSSADLRFLEHLSRPHNGTLDGDAVAISRASSVHYTLHRPARGMAACGPPPAFPASVRPSCTALLAANTTALAGVRLVLGITSAPDRFGQRRRNGIRSTWMRHAAAPGSDTLVCFVVGRRGVKERELTRLDAEAAQHADLVFLPHVRDGDGPFVTISKAHAWFRLACELLGLISRGEDALHSNSPRSVLGGYAAVARHHVRHIAKVDDDTYLHLPVMQRDLDAMHCHPARARPPPGVLLSFERPDRGPPRAKKPADEQVVRCWSPARPAPLLWRLRLRGLQLAHLHQVRLRLLAQGRPLPQVWLRAATARASGARRGAPALPVDVWRADDRLNRCGATTLRSGGLWARSVPCPLVPLCLCRSPRGLARSSPPSLCSPQR